MQNEALDRIAQLSDGELVARLRALTGDERRATAAVVAHLAVLDTREVHLREGYSSLFAYCQAELGLSEHAAYNRIEVARAAQRFPVILDRLADGSVNLTAIRLLARRLTAENHVDVLESARGLTRPQVEELVARLAPKPDARTLLRRIPDPPSGQVATGAEKPATPQPPPVVVAPEPKAKVTPLAPERYRLQVTIDAATRAKLQQAKDLLRHAVPSGDEAEILSRALDALLAQVAREKCAETSQPRPARTATPVGRHIPAVVRRAVWVRDGGRCAFVARSGHRCADRARIEFHHRDPYARGGESTVGNIELRCRAHNQYEGRLDFGTRPGTSSLRPEPTVAGVP